MSNEQLRDMMISAMNAHAQQTAAFEARISRLELAQSGGGDGVREREARDLIPKGFEPERDSFKAYALDVRNWILAMADAGGTLLDAAARGDDIDLDPTAEGVKATLSRRLYQILVKTTSGSAKTITTTGSVGDGFKSLASNDHAI